MKFFYSARSLRPCYQEMKIGWKQYAICSVSRKIYKKWVKKGYFL